MAAVAEKIPYEVGRFSRGWSLLIAGLVVLVAIGAFAYSIQLRQGEVVTGMRDIGTMRGAPWGLYITFMMFSLGVGVAGISLAALVRVLNIAVLRPFVRMAEVLSIAAVIVGMTAIIVDLGQPLRGIFNLLKYGRPQSPFFGTMTLAVAYLLASLLYLFLDTRRDAALLAQKPGRLQWLYRVWASGYQDTAVERDRHNRAAFWLAMSVLVLLVLYHATLGFVFGLQVARPGWFTPLLALWHLTLNAVSGIGGILVLIAATLRVVFKAEDILTKDAFRLLGNLLMVSIAGFIFVLFLEFMTATYEAPPVEMGVTVALFAGPYAWITWLSLSLMVVALVQLFAQFALRQYHMALIVEAAALVTIATFLQRLVIVLPSQTHGLRLPYDVGYYAPSLVEIGVVLGLVAMGALIFTMFMKLFPILELSRPWEPPQEPVPEEVRAPRA
jgi:Ni/Fe-hydrogenase subunit HybB-like protein